MSECFLSFKHVEDAAALRKVYKGYKFKMDSSKKIKFEKIVANYREKLKEKEKASKEAARAAKKAKQRDDDPAYS